jgi:hypothetical protein
VTRNLIIAPKGKRSVLQGLTLPAGSYHLVLEVKSADDSNAANNVFVSPLITVT